MLWSLFIAILLSFSFRIVQRVVGLIYKQHLRFSVYYWGIMVIIASLLIKNTYVYSFPKNLSTVLPLFFIILIVNCLISRSSGYSPAGRFDRFNFVIIYPVLEEIAFRGLAQPVLTRHHSLGQIHHTPVIELSFAVVITAALFAVSHLQYYKLNSQSIRFMIFAFAGGLFFGLITQMTESIMLTIPLHIAFNGSAAFYAYLIAKKQSNSMYS
ncbi:CPBP family intramembrane glutamic endopeptidase [Paenibacillus sp. FSL L8-0340]|uniref:CPBP family intramembrane glutamic endopeptidase n=1 Tax=Paenibacillus sp. FSL L8-0340 TaxID=2954685 RepID=UPI0031580352